MTPEQAINEAMLVGTNDEQHSKAASLLQQVLTDSPGALKIITAEAADPNMDTRDPHAWVLHDVVRITGPDNEGYMWAYSDEGDITMGKPLHVLQRLSEHRRPFTLGVMPPVGR